MDVGAVIVEPGGGLFQHPEAEIFEDRNDIGQGYEAALPIDFEPQLALRIDRQPVEPDRSRPLMLEPVEPKDIEGGVVHRIARPIGRRKMRGVRQGQARGACIARELRQFRLDARRPAADHFIELAIQLARVRRRPLILDRESISDQGEIPVAEIDRPVGLPAVGGIRDHLADIDPAARRQFVAGKPDEREQMALED